MNSIAKLFLILEELARSETKIKITQLAQNLQIPISTIHRYLSSLMDLGYVIQDIETGEYTLGVKILSLANAVLTKLDLRNIAYPYLVDLRNATGETANLVVFDSDEVLYIERVESKLMVRALSLIGKRAPVHATGVGKVFLSDMAWHRVLTILKNKGMKRLTPNTIVNINDFMDELNQVRKQGYAFDNEECELGATCIAAPVRDYTGAIVACISISGPTSRLRDKRQEELISQLLSNSSKLSKTLGFKGL